MSERGPGVNDGGPDTSAGYVLEVQPSARRTNGAVGAAVHRDGTRYSFDDRAAAEDWAADLAARGERPVWVRAANPNDERGVDAYLMGRYRRVESDRAVGAPTEGGPPRDDQSRLPVANGD